MLVDEENLSYYSTIGEKTAVRCNGESISYKELLQKANYLTEALNYPRNSRAKIGIFLNNSINFITVFIGLILHRHIAVIFDPKWPESKFKEAGTVVPVSLIITEKGLIEKVKTSSAPTRIVLIEDIVTDSQGYLSLIENQKRTPFFPIKNYKQTLFISFTSGTTSSPKAFAQTYGSWINSFKGSINEFDITPDDIVFAPGPLSHGLTLYPCIEGLHEGASIIISPAFESDNIIKTILNYPISSLIAVPTMLFKILQKMKEEKLIIKNVKRIITAGAKLEKQLMDNLQSCFPGVIIYEYYGASELGFVTIKSTEEKIPQESVGRAFRDVEIEIRRDNATSADTGETGTVWVKSPYISKGYLDDLPAVQSGFILKKGWATVGDMGYMDHNSHLFLIGRKNNMMISGGYNVFPQELEQLFLKHPQVEDALAFGVEDPEWGTKICIALRLINEEGTNKKNFMEFSKKNLPSYKCPKHFYIVSNFPLTNSGKKSRELLKEILDKNNNTIKELL